MSKRKSISCDFKPAKKGSGKKPSSKKKPDSRLLSHDGSYGWRGAPEERYKQDDGTWADVIRRTLIGGRRAERTRFHLRYFEVAPGGRTTHESHGHEHVVVVVRGKGRCKISGRWRELGYLDTLYVSPDAPHQLSNPYVEPFGFFCIVDAERDRPRPEPG